MRALNPYPKIFGARAFFASTQNPIFKSSYSNFGRKCVLAYKYLTSICKQLRLLKVLESNSIVIYYYNIKALPTCNKAAACKLYNSIISFEWTRFRSGQMQPATTAAASRFNNVLFIPEHSTDCILLSLLASEVKTEKWIFLNVQELMTHRNHTVYTCNSRIVMSEHDWTRSTGTEFPTSIKSKQV